MDTAAVLVSRRALVLVDAELAGVAAACARLAGDHRGTVMAAIKLPSLLSGVKWMQGPPFNQSIIFLGLTLVLLTMGPGKLSADGLLFSKKPAGKPA